MSQRCLILANAKAGRLKRFRRASDSADASLTRLAEAAAGGGLNATVEAVPAPFRLKARLCAALDEGFDTVVAAGGDGTVRPVAQALTGLPLRLGILPVGSANNFARALGLPASLDGAIRVIAAGETRLVDAGRIKNEIFTEGAGVGLFAATLAEFGPDGPRASRLLQDMRTTLALCWNPPVYRLHLTLDGASRDEEAVLVAVCNSAYLGANFAVAPDACLDDGLFDVVIVGPLSRRELFGFGVALLRGNLLELPKVSRVRARTVEISRIRRSHRRLPVHADDHIAAYTPARLEVVPAALRVLTPATAAVETASGTIPMLTPQPIFLAERP
jgi:YegS/Rv2252/BmrU family lipid kinase